jgi:alanyl-tRNA synthetase
MTHPLSETHMLYRENVYTKESRAKVVDILIHRNGQPLIVLDTTPFFPEGGGQPSDHGEIGGVPVDHVYEKDSIVYHRAACSAESGISFKPGDEVSAVIDWAYRFENMQRHCGEHILSGVFHKKYNAANKGFHMGRDYMTVDMDFRGSSHEDISVEEIFEAEQLANSIIWQDLPVEVRRFKTQEEADSFPHRKQLTIYDDISLVCIGSWQDPADLVACCGTHPESTAQVGLLKIYKVEKNKGMFRIYFDAGKKAMDEYDRCYAIIKDLADSHSTGIDTLKDRLSKDAAHHQKTKDELNKIRNRIASQISSELLAAMKRKQEKHGRKVVNLLASGAELDDYTRAVKNIEDKIKGLLVLSFPAQKTVLLQSDGSFDCGSIVREHGSAHNAKGGGSATSARAVFENNADLVAFTDEISPRGNS